MKMRTLLYAGVATSALLTAAQASADVFVEADITKHKDITVTENITITKTIDLSVFVNVVPEKSAEATGIINQENYANKACGNCAEKKDEIIGSLGAGAETGNVGIVNVNQSSGNMNNQGNAVSVAVDAVHGLPPASPPPPGVPPTVDPADGGFANSQAHVEQVNGVEGSDTEQTAVLATPAPAPNVVDTVNLLFRDAVIENSINNNIGVVNVNQSPGQMNNQANIISIAVSLAGDGGAALSESDLGQVNRLNQARESDSLSASNTDPLFGINKTATINNSINGNTGIVGVNQASGNMANQANGVSAAAVVVGGGAPL